jgi:dihydrofolate reductase
MKTHLIWAQDKNSGIGKAGDLPWHISEDLKNFKLLTLGSVIVMGRKTWESLPFKPLPKRRNIVLSSQILTDIETYSSVENCITTLKQDGVEQIFVIGGAQIYKEFFQYADVLHITVVDDIVENIDTYFPVNLKDITLEFKKSEEKKLSPIARYMRYDKK